MNKKYDVTALGELLIDFTENGISAQGNPVMEANPGGAPCNVLAILQRLGHSTAFLGKVGKDMFGDQLETAIREAGISAEGLIRDNRIHTTLAFVHTFPDGDRDFSFYRKPGADMMLKKEEICEEMIENSRIFHFGSLSMTDEPCRSATKHAVSIAENAGALISFDPNLREPLWDSLDTAREMIDYGMRHCDILKISDNEILWFTGKSSYEEAVKELQQHYEPKLLLLSLGKEGSMAFTEKANAYVPSFLQENTIETTGAGDTFCGSVLHYVLEHGLEALDGSALREMLRFANAAASIITTRRGALRVMPSMDEIQALL
ncbi:MAG: carbohydrate kinase [Lachnospiraceae bacterium]|nr:carbohydrate kinase [Lachnospiraceae bacterium]